MQQSKKKQADKITNEKILLEVLLDLKTGSLRELTARLALCEIALKKWGYIYNEASLLYQLHTNKSLLNDWNNICSSNIEDLNVNTTKGRLELRSCFSLVKKLIGSYYKDENKNFSQLQKACMLLGSYNYKNLQIKDIITFFNLEALLRGVVCESIGYWTAKLERMKQAHESQETKKQQREIKEEYVIKAYVRLINDEKKVFANISNNKIAERIKEYVLPLLINKKTETDVPVLKPKFDKDSEIKYSGLSIDTIIDIMSNTKTDKIKTNPFKK